MAFGLWKKNWPLIIFWVFLRSTELKSLIFNSKLHVFAIKTFISSNLPKRISVYCGYSRWCGKQRLQQSKSHVLTVLLLIPFNELPEFKYYSACQVCNVAATFAEKNTSPFLQGFFFSPWFYVIFLICKKSQFLFWLPSGIRLGLVFRL